jgi:hypothetical protein
VQYFNITLQMLSALFIYSITLPLHYFYYQPVLWIRIRKNPMFLAGSESEKISDSDTRFGTRYFQKIKIRKPDVKHLRENKMHAFSRAKLFFCFTGSGIRTGTCERNDSHSLENWRVKILVIESESVSEAESESGFKKFWIRIRKKIFRIHNTATSTVYYKCLE